ncbi:MAG: Phytoene dehydrogenase, partial [uncultured Actinomycetospora sp.]
VRRGALVLPDGSVPPVEPGAEGRRRRVLWVRHPAGGRGADGAGVGPAGRRADPRSGPHLPLPRAPARRGPPGPGAAPGL